MTVTGPAPKRISLPFFANCYFVRLDSVSLTNNLDLIFLELNRGIEGSLDGLNPEIFELVQRGKSQYLQPEQ